MPTPISHAKIPSRNGCCNYIEEQNIAPHLYQEHNESCVSVEIGSLKTRTINPEPSDRQVGSEISGGVMNTDCVVCGTGKPQFALPLRREKGEWVVKPLCGGCRYTLGREARAQKKFIPMYELAASLKEAAKRNAQRGKYKLLVDAFAKAKAKKQ